MNNDDKHNYWADQISKNQHKKHEIHTIISIKERLHQKLRDDFWNIRPQFQAPVLRPNHKFAFIDLYFPFFGVGIEIDEQQHENKKNKDADTERTLDLIQQLQASQRKDYKEIRIKPYIEKDFEQGVNEVVDLIVREYESSETKPVWNLDPFSFYKGKNEMSVKDEVIFKNKQELIGVMLNIKDYHNRAPGFPKNKYPALSQNGYEFYVFNKDSLYIKKMNGKRKKGVERYYNVFREDFSEFRMYSDRFNNPDIRTKDEQKMKKQDKIPKRVIGAKSKNGVVFCGVYEFDGFQEDPKPQYSDMSYYQSYKIISRSFSFDLCRKVISNHK